MGTGRCERKVPGGKLLRVEVRTEGAVVRRALVRGDFFLHPEERIEDLEAALEGLDQPEAMREAAQRALDGAVAVGITVEDLGNALIEAWRAASERGD